MNALNREGNLPKTIIYSLNPTDNALIGTMIGCFQGDGVRGKIQQGAAWWFNDHKYGMEEHMKSLASLSLSWQFCWYADGFREVLFHIRVMSISAVFYAIISEILWKMESTRRIMTS